MSSIIDHNKQHHLVRFEHSQANSSSTGPIGPPLLSTPLPIDLDAVSKLNHLRKLAPPTNMFLLNFLLLSLLLPAGAGQWGINRRASFARPFAVQPGILTVQETGPLCVATIRGGASMMADNDDDDEEEESDFDDFDDEELMFEEDDEFEDEFEMAESDFAEDNTVDRMVDAWKKTPPLTKAYLSASFGATLYGFLFNKNEFPKILLLEWKPVLQRLQIWRIFTAFLNIGPLGLGYAMTAQFVWTYMSTLERLNHSRPFDFWIMIGFGMISMVVGYPVFKLSPRFLGHNLSTFLVYIWSRYHEGLEVSMFDLFNTRAELLPWFFLAQTFLLEGEMPVLDFLGIVFGHVYHHCKTVGILRAPDALVEWYKGDSQLATRIRSQYKTISSDFELV